MMIFFLSLTLGTCFNDTKKWMDDEISIVFFFSGYGVLTIFLWGGSFYYCFSSMISQ